MDGLEVSGYPAWASVVAGESLRLHVSTRASKFRADFYRFGNQIRYAGSCDWPGVYAPEGAFDQDWQWPGYDFAVPSDWEPGVYIAVLGTDASRPILRMPGETLDARSQRLLFVVRPTSARHGLLFKLPLSTYHAYNQAGGGSLYGACDRAALAAVPTVSFRRPGGGVGGPVKGAPDHYDLASPRQTFAHWDAKFLAWLEGEGIGYDVCTDLDLDQGLALDGYRLLVSAGHDEYWSARTRNLVEEFCARGGNLAVFGANTCWWRTHLDTDGGVLACEKFPAGAQDVDPDSTRGCPDKWFESRPENSLLGASYRNGGGHWDGARGRIGFAVRDAKHWIFDGARVMSEQVIGAAEALVGYECDGAELEPDRAGRLNLTHQDATPRGLELVGVALLPTDPGSGWSFPARERYGGIRAATMSIHTTDGTVFNAGTTDWPRLLPTDPAVQRITRNVLHRLGAGGGTE